VGVPTSVADMHFVPHPRGRFTDPHSVSARHSTVCWPLALMAAEVAWVDFQDKVRPMLTANHICAH